MQQNPSHKTKGFLKVLEYISKEEIKFGLFKNFFKTGQDVDKKNADVIGEFTKEIAELANQISNKNIAKMVKNYSIHRIEVEHSGQMHQLVAEKINFWLQELNQKYNAIKEKTRNMERRKQLLNDAQFQTFKKELTQEMLTIANRKEVTMKLEQSIMQLYCYMMIKNSSQQLQTLTGHLQTTKQKASQVVKKIQ